MDIEDIRRRATAALDPSRRSELGQFFTPSGIAAYMASMFTPAHYDVRLLDAGAGVGCLLHAASRRMRIDRIDAWELDSNLIEPLAATLAATGVSYEIHFSDFILAAPDFRENAGVFDRAILNPPYRKISNASAHRKVMEELGVKTVNLYTAFVAAALLAMADGGEIVAIVPRSFLNGLYHRPFREFMLSMASLDAIHVFNSRRSAFSEDAVLQENVIIKLTRRGKQGNVSVSSSDDGGFTNVVAFTSTFARIVAPNDRNMFIRIPTNADDHLDGVSLADLRIDVSTGPIVEFRVRGSVVAGDDGVQLVTPKHLTNAGFTHPSAIAKANRLSRDAVVLKDVWPSGDYVVVKRISSKESRRRILAYHMRPEDLSGSVVAFENHLNVFHSGKRGLDPLVAARLCDYLNSEVADIEFRSISGSTQVNATDLRAMSYPPSIISSKI
jgi:adenine-specific DNA-methyltransferase